MERERLAVTVPEAAEMLGVSRWQAYKLVRTGAIPSVKLGPRSTRILVKDLEEHLRQMSRSCEEGRTA